MKKITLAATFLLAFFASIFAQKDTTSGPPETFLISLSHDPVFGFLPSATGSFAMSKKWSFTFYGNFWTNAAYGDPTAGTDFWLESGIGAATLASKGRLFINPSLGMTHGKLLSGGTEAAFAEGLVPSTVVLFLGRKIEGEFYAAYYKSLRKRGPVTTDYLLAWALPGFILDKNVSMGGHFETFYQSRRTGDTAKSLYNMAGGYVKFRVAGGRHFLRFSAGKNFVSRTTGGYPTAFYRLTVGLSML